MIDSDQFKLLASARDACGEVVVVRPFEKVLKVKITDAKVSVLFQTFGYTETATRITFTKRGKRLWEYDRSNGLSSGMTIWDEDYAGEVEVKFGRVYEGTSHRDKRQFEKDCYRPGGGRFPLDNFNRVTAGDTTPEMERYWTRS